MQDENANENGTESVRLAGFTIKNILGVKLVEVAVQAGKTIIFGGKNRQGKSSILKALWMGLGGKSAVYDDAIRHGQTQGSVEIDVDDYRVKLVLDSTRGPKFEVRRKDGTIVRSPMALIKEWIGLIGFDPLEFMRLGQTRDGRAKQSEMLMRMAGLDFDAIDLEYAETFEKRTAVNRDVKALEATLASLPFDPEAPAEPVSVTDLLDEISKADDTNSEIDAEQSAHREALRLLKAAEEQAEKMEKALADQRADIKVAQESIAKLYAGVEDLEHIDTTPLRNQIATAEQTNAVVRANEAHKKAKARLADEQVKQSELTMDLDAIKAKKATDLANARFPLDGLSVRGETNDPVYNGVPLENLSDSEQIMVSTELALANAGKLKLAMIDGIEALDAASIKLIRDRVEARGGNLIASMVSDSEDCSFIIEGGEIMENTDG